MIKVQPSLAVRKVTPSSTKIGRLITWWCKCKYYHVELILEERWLSADPDNGVYWNVDLPEDHAEYDIIHLPEIEMNYDTYEKVKDFIKQQVSPKYDIMGLVWNQVFGINTYVSDRWYCSEIVIVILQYLGYYRFYGYTGNELSPQDIYDIVTSETDHPDIEIRRYSILNRLKRVYKKIKNFIVKLIGKLGFKIVKEYIVNKVTNGFSYIKKLFKKMKRG